MSEKELKWAISGTLALILALSMGLNGAIFQDSNDAKLAKNATTQSRGIASTIAPVVNIAWEKRAFEVLKNADTRDVASVGKTPGPYDELSFGVLEGKYAIQLMEGKISEIHFTKGDESKPKFIGDRTQFLNQYRKLIAGDAGQIKPTFAESNGEMTVEKYQLASTEGQVLATVEFRLDSDDRLLSLTVQ